MINEEVEYNDYELNEFFDKITKEYCLGSNEDIKIFPEVWRTIIAFNGDEEIKKNYKEDYVSEVMPETVFFTNYLEIAVRRGTSRNSVQPRNFSELSVESKKRLEKFYKLVNESSLEAFKKEKYTKYIGIDDGEHTISYEVENGKINVIKVYEKKKKKI